MDPSGTQSHEPELVRVPERPKGMPANVTRWAYSGTSVLTGSEERFAELTAGKQVFVLDPEAPAENLAKLKKAEHLRDVEAMSGAMREALGGGAAKGGGGSGSAEGAGAAGGAEPKSWLEKFAEELAYAGATANLRMGEDTHRPDASPYGIVGGRNANGPQSPVVQGVAGAAMIAAAVLVQTSAFEQALRKAIRTGQKLVYDLSVPAAKKLAERYGWKMAAALEHITARLRQATAGAKTPADLWVAYQQVYADKSHWLAWTTASPRSTTTPSASTPTRDPGPPREDIMKSLAAPSPRRCLRISNPTPAAAGPRRAIDPPHTAEHTAMEHTYTIQDILYL